ncbi:MAG: 50S ribosomal protein L18 [Deltaproteobacteria bacterium]|nr:50S ribosomal protein L18 [Deltaproteobacteria bacterium]
MALQRKSLDTKTVQRLNRKARIRKRVAGTAERPRLTVFKSGKHTYAQVIDDVSGKTLASASTMAKALKSATKELKPADAAKQVGEAIAAACKAANITQVAFDRNGYPYHGRVKVLAEAAREKGLSF